MKQISNKALRGGTFIGIGILIAMFIGVIVITITSLNANLNSEAAFNNSFFNQVLPIYKIKTELAHSRIEIMQILLTEDPEQRRKLFQEHEAGSRVIENTLDAAMLEEKNIKSSIYMQLNDLKAILIKDNNTRSTINDLINARKINEAKAIMSGVQMARHNEMGNLVDLIIAQSKKQFEDNIDAQQRKLNAEINYYILFSLIAVIIAVGILVLVHRNYNRMIIASQYARNLIEANLDPLVTISPEGKITDVNEATVKVTGVSKENLIGTDFSDYFTEPETARAGYLQVFEKGSVIDYPLTIRHISGRQTHVLYNASVYRGVDGKVLGVFAAARDITDKKRLDEELKELNLSLELRINERTENLVNQTQEIIKAINILTVSTTEILTATSQVASSVSETASAINETTTTVEEVSQTAQVSAQKAKFVSESAQKTAQISINGKKSVEDTINVMSKIREQVEAVAESIVKLSEQSQDIGEIIATVNDIADQSNLLSVNAAIEAAKAGEQGKGFTVVAKEVKSLAEQSKQATSKVRAILSDVQRAMSAAVMATESGTRAVETGVKQSMETGESIRLLAESITESAQSAVQISVSSQQQMVGMDQIAQAMVNIRQASEQNMVGTKQAEDAARSISDLGKKLKELVEKYKV